MAEQTPALAITYPSENQELFFRSFEDGIIQMDGFHFDALDDRNLISLSSAVITFGVDGTVSWNAPIVLHHSASGFRGTLAAGSVALENDQGAYVRVVRGAEQGYELSLTVTSNRVPREGNVIVLFYRANDILFVRGLGSAQLGATIEASVSGPLSTSPLDGQSTTVLIPLSLKQSQGAPLSVGARRRIIPSEYINDNATVTFTFKVEAQVNPAALAGVVRLLDRTTGGPGVELVSFAVTSDQPTEQTFTLVPTAPLTAVKIYEVEFGLDPNGGPYQDTDEILLWHATIEVKNEFPNP